MTYANEEDGTQKIPLLMTTGLAVTTHMRADTEEGEATTLEILHSLSGSWIPGSQEL
ncbi:hypothetical protein A2U01_0117082, partial [Trifolium medium]|nr:hypothetical protein [Trifolium medium]